MAITIHPELYSLIPPLTPEEYTQLEANIRADGCHDPLIVWQETQTLLDGHNRLQICAQHGLDYRLHEVSLPDLDAAKAWMIAHQLGRRNLTPDQMSYYRGEQYNLQKQRHGGDRKSEASSSQNENLKTVDRLAAEHGVSRATIARDGVYADAVETLAAVLGPDARQAILAGDLHLTRQDVPLLASLVEKSPETATQVKEALQGAAPADGIRAVLTAAQCGICHRPLSDPASVSRGIGPICAGHGNGEHRPPRGPGGGGTAAPPIPPAVLARLSDRERARFGPRNEKPLGSIEWCWQTLDLLKIRWQRKDFTDQQFEETLEELRQQKVWKVVPPEQPYGTLAALLSAEVGLDFFSRLDATMWSLEVFHTSITTLTPADTGDPEVDMAHVVAVCLAFKARYAQVEHALRQAFPAFEATYGAPAGPAAPPAPAPLIQAGGYPIRERNYCIVHVRHQKKGSADFDPCSIEHCHQTAHYFFWTHHPHRDGPAWTRYHSLCPQHAAEWCTAHQVDIKAIPTISSAAWVNAWGTGNYDQVPWFRFAAPGASSEPTPAPDTAPSREDVGLQMAVWQMVKKLQPCANADVAKALGEKRNATHQALQALVKQGKARKEGQTYSVVDAPGVGGDA